MTNLSAALAAIEHHHDQVNELRGPINSAYQRKLDGSRSINTAEQANDAQLGYQQVMDASAELKALYDHVQLAIDKAEEAKEGHDQYEREARCADEITYDEFNTNTDAVQAAFSAFYNTARSARDQASKSATRAAQLDLAARAQFFAVTDPTSMAAFWASLRESCQP